VVRDAAKSLVVLALQQLVWLQAAAAAAGNELGFLMFV
jgi:hypothetical protein